MFFHDIFGTERPSIRVIIRNKKQKQSGLRSADDVYRFLLPPRERNTSVPLYVRRLWRTAVPTTPDSKRSDNDGISIRELRDGRDGCVCISEIHPNRVLGVKQRYILYVRIAYPEKEIHTNIFPRRFIHAVHEINLRSKYFLSFEMLR